MKQRTMKKLKFIVFALFAMLACVNLTACSDDDDVKSNSLENSSWNVVASDDPDGCFPKGMTITFKSDGNMKFKAPVGWKPDEERDYIGWPYAKWELDSNELTIIAGEDGPDDKMVGQFTIKDKNAIYQYHWEDYFGKWDNSDEIYTLTLSRL